MRLIKSRIVLFADFLVERPTLQGATFSLVLKSKNGQGYNPDYYVVLEELLVLLGMHNCIVMRISLDSTTAMKFPEADRILPISFPIQLSSSIDYLELRKKISDTQSRIITKAKSGSGNSHRRIRIEIQSKIEAKSIFGEGETVEI